jgi:putative sterol carrier protein
MKGSEKMSRKIWNKNIVINEIKELHKNGTALNSKNMRSMYPRLYDASVRHFDEGLKGAIEAAGIDYSDIKLRKNLSMEEVVKEICRMHANGDSLRLSYIGRYHHSLYNAAKKYFGSWGEAVEACKIDYDAVKSTKKWTKDLVIQEIQKLHNNGESIGSKYVRDKYPVLQIAACRNFNNWGSAVEAAGFDYSKIKRGGKKWTKDLVIQEIQKLHSNGESLSSRNIQNNYPAIHGAAFRAFGSWGKAVEACKFEYNKIKKRVSWDKDMVMTEIRRIYDSCEGNLEVLKSRFIKKNNIPLYGAAQRNFGNWGEAIKACGLNYEEIRGTKKWDKSSVIREIKKLHDSGSKLNSTYILENHSDLYSAANVWYNGWENAIVAFGLNYDEIRKYKSWTKEKIISEINRLNKSNIRINSRNVKEKYPALHGASCCHFGSWKEAIEAAGLNYNDVALIRGSGWGSTCIGNDNNTYLSYIESNVANIIHNLNVNGLIKKYDTQVVVAGNKKWKCDFLIEFLDDSKLWLEVDGLGQGRFAPYDSGKNEKIEFYKNNNYNFAIALSVESTKDILSKYVDANSIMLFGDKEVNR